MSRQDVTLSDRYDLTKHQVLLNGTQALVRLMLMQSARDRAEGHRTAGLVSGYRGSPLGGVDLMMMREEARLRAADVRFIPGLNEDLAATAIWGSQQAGLRGEGAFDGVFALWYGKGPGVDRSGDVMRHANMAGSAALGGVVMAMGDDHTGESSTVLHQSDWAMVDAYIPVLAPAGVQEILDYGLYGFALSRYSGLWTGLKTMKDTVEATSVVQGDPFRLRFRLPERALPEGGLSIRLGDTPLAQEARMIDHKRFAAEAFARANGIDRRVWGRAGAKIGLVSAGKSWLDLVHALELLGLDGHEAERLGLTTYKIGQTWPLDMRGFHDWAEGLDLIVVVEEKRKLIEVQVKEAIFDDRRGRRVYGWKHALTGAELFPTRYALDPVMIAERLAQILIEEGRGTESVKAAQARLAQARLADNAPDLAARQPWFCSGCPHNRSTRLPEGARAYAGIGCHYMVQWMGRETEGFTQMGGEGANWIGEAPFSTRKHVFQNLGDGTYNHSGVQAIRAALAAGVNITYKILFNDAVAMTGGQATEGGLTPGQILRELQAMGLREIALVQDEKEPLDPSEIPPGVSVQGRAALMAVQRRLQEVPGVTAIVYVQTCAAEKRRRRKRGRFADPDQRVFINTDICEGCGDCGLQSNCVSIVPVETELGRKRAIDQSSCNKDFSCLDGFCPSFVTLQGARPRAEGGAARAEGGAGQDPGKGPDLEALAEAWTKGLAAPDLPALQGCHNTLITGVGGTGVVTVGAVLAMAAHLDGRGVGMMEMAGLAQKGGAVQIHLRIAPDPGAITAIRVGLGEADSIIGGDLVVTAGAKILALMTRGKTRALVNSHEIITGAFTRDRDFQLPSAGLRLALSARLAEGLQLFDATALSARLLGDAIYANMVVLGAAWQAGLVPLRHDAIARAIALNGAAVAGNRAAFALGRWAQAHPQAAADVLGQTADAGSDQGAPDSAAALAGRIAFREDHLRAYQDAALARRYRALVDGAPLPLREAVALSYHRLLACKDEYEVARLHLQSLAKARGQFDGDLRPVFHLAPPFLGGKGPDGRPRKRAFGPWILPVFGLLARARRLRGGWLDPFRFLPERRQERALCAEYEADMTRLFALYDPARHGPAAELAALPQAIRGFGPVKDAAMAQAAKRRVALWQDLLAGPGPQPAPPPERLIHAAQ